MTPTQALHHGWGLNALVTPLGEGHINDTYLAQVSTAPSAGKNSRWVLQRINRMVFRDPQLVMKNVAAASAHLNRKRPGWTPALIPASDGRQWAELDGEVWRLWSYIEGRTLPRLQNDAQAEAAGRAFGRTRRWLQDIDGLGRREVIPNFLQLPHYLAAYDAGPKAEPKLAAFIDARRHLAERLRQPNGYIHGDCKVDNLIFDDENEVLAVLDLDTLMRGHWAWEFGDLVRSALAEAARPARFKAAAKGYLDEAEVRADVDDLILAPRYVAFMLGIRLLTDHLQGDRYFKVSAPGENRERALTQFRLLEAMETEEPAFRDCAADVLARSIQRNDVPS